MNVAVVAQTHDGEADQGAHVEGEDGYEHGLHTLQVTVEQDGHEHDLPGEEHVMLPRSRTPRKHNPPGERPHAGVNRSGNHITGQTDLIIIWLLKLTLCISYNGLIQLQHQSVYQSRRPLLQ